MSSVPWLAGKSQWEQIHSYFKKPWMRLKNQIRRKLGIWKSWNILGKPWYAIFQEYELYESSAFGLGFSPGTWLTWLYGFTTSKPSAPGSQFESQFDVDSRKETPHLSKILRFFFVFPWVESTMTGESTMCHKTIQNLASKLMYWLWNLYWYDWNLCPASATLVLQPSYLEDVGYPTNLSHHLPLKASHYNPAFIWLTKALRVYIE